MLIFSLRFKVYPSSHLRGFSSASGSSGALACSGSTSFLLVKFLLQRGPMCPPTLLAPVPFPLRTADADVGNEFPKSLVLGLLTRGHKEDLYLHDCSKADSKSYRDAGPEGSEV